MKKTDPGPGRRKEKKAAVVKTVRTPKIDPKIMRLTLKGLSPLLTDRLSDDVLNSIETTQTGGFKGPREHRDPKKEYERSKYIQKIGGKMMDCFPSSGVKGALVKACGDKSLGIFKSIVKGVIHPTQEWLPLKYSKVLMHRALGRNKDGGRTPRYRAEYHDWELPLELRYDATALSPEQIVGLINVAGFRVGIGNWTPQSGNSGGFRGTFQVKG